MTQAPHRDSIIPTFMAGPQSLPWMDPLTLAAAVDEPHWVLLYSGVRAGDSGRYSYLVHRLSDRIESDDFAELATRLTDNKDTFSNAWFGYLGYGLKNGLEKLATDTPHPFGLPHLCMMKFDCIYRFDHEAQTVHYYCATSQPPLAPGATTDIKLPDVADIRSNMSRDAYLDKAAQVIARIHAGDLYQANLTRKFMGSFKAIPDAFTLFRKLCAASPAAYSAYIRLGDRHIVSSSPEMFLKTDADGNAFTRPIKGSAPRSSDPARDRESRERLSASVKDRAENLMIVDLMRNDLARNCEAGSVAVKSLFDITSHATIHHMSSSIAGKKRTECSTLDLVKGCFPPGSMTGAPKIRAMNLCSELERLERGVYSGSIGWFGGDGSCEMSVVIRTLVLQGARFEFQVGGGIVADSTPACEWQETIDKAKGLLAALGLAPAAIESL